MIDLSLVLICVFIYIHVQVRLWSSKLDVMLRVYYNILSYT